MSAASGFDSMAVGMTLMVAAVKISYPWKERTLGRGKREHVTLSRIDYGDPKKVTGSELCSRWR